MKKDCVVSYEPKDLQKAFSILTSRIEDVGYKCRCCETGNLIPLNDLALIPTFLMGENCDIKSPSECDEYIMLRCNWCGIVQNHSLQVLLGEPDISWLSGNYQSLRGGR